MQCAELRKRWEASEAKYHAAREAQLAAAATAEGSVAQLALLHEQRAALTADVARLQQRLGAAEAANQTPKVRRLQELEAEVAAASEEVTRLHEEVAHMQRESLGFRRRAEEQEVRSYVHFFFYCVLCFVVFCWNLSSCVAFCCCCFSTSLNLTTLSSRIT